MAETTHQERDTLRDVVRQLLAQATPAEQKWARLVDEIGATGLLVPQSLGGAGGALPDAAALLEEAGRVPFALPLISTVALATPMLRACDHIPEAERLLRAVAGGATATVAFLEPGSDWFAPAASTVADKGPDGWRLRGHKTAVLDAGTADIVLVAAATSDGPGLFAVTGAAAGLRRLTAESFDLSKELGTVDLVDTPATVLCVGEAAGTAVAAGLELGLALILTEQVGCAAAGLEAAVDYAKIRVQFDRPIGSFQAVKHKLVDILLEVELARAAVDAAVQAGDTWLDVRTAESLVALQWATSAAKAIAADGCMFAAEETLHVFGGIGFTWEHDAHRRFRRAKFGQLYLGTAEEHRERLAVLAGLPSPTTKSAAG